MHRRKKETQKTKTKGQKEKLKIKGKGKETTSKEKKGDRCPKGSSRPPRTMKNKGEKRKKEKPTKKPKEKQQPAKRAGSTKTLRRTVANVDIKPGDIIILRRITDEEAKAEAEEANQNTRIQREEGG